MQNTTFTIASTTQDYELAKLLFTEYANEIEGDICFQNFNQELQKLPEIYGEPAGALIIAFAADKPVGCIGLKPLNADQAEIKRLYLKKESRGSGLGKELLSRIIQIAREKKYNTLKLDTLPAMATAIQMYQNFGFQETTPQGPQNEVRYFELDLV